MDNESQQQLNWARYERCSSSDYANAPLLGFVLLRVVGIPSHVVAS